MKKKKTGNICLKHFSVKPYCAFHSITLPHQDEDAIVGGPYCWQTCSLLSVAADGTVSQAVFSPTVGQLPAPSVAGVQLLSNSWAMGGNTPMCSYNSWLGNLYKWFSLVNSSYYSSLCLSEWELIVKESHLKNPQKKHLQIGSL